MMLFFKSNVKPQGIKQNKIIVDKRMQAVHNIHYFINSRFPNHCGYQKSAGIETHRFWVPTLQRWLELSPMGQLRLGPAI